MKACLRAGMKVSGPPQKRMPGFSSQPWERVVTVCTATAWKMDAAMSVFGTFLLIRFCTSVLEKTPHREAMGRLSGQRIELVYLRAEQQGHLVDECARSACTVAVHAQVGLSVVAQIDDFRIFAAYVYDGRYAVFPLPYVLDGGDYLLYERYRETFRNTHSDRPRHRYRHLRVAQTGGGIVQQAGDDSVDVGLMAPVVAECHFAPWVEYHYFGRGRTDIQAKPVAVVVHIVSSPFIFHRNRTMTGTAGAGPCVHTYRSFLWR